jgi:hypothetical protein
VISLNSQISLDNNNLLDCLQKQIDNIVNVECREEILKISEFQGESIALDRSLSKSCELDKARFCSELQNNVDEEPMYKCLQEFMNELSSQVTMTKLFSYPLRRLLL